MGVLRHPATGTLSTLEAEHLVGRSVRASLRLDESYVSSQHASIRWAGAHWEIKDLGSRNGTSMGDAPLVPGQPVRLERGARVHFGRPEQTWEMLDDAAPRAMVVSTEPYEVLFFEGDLLALPSPHDPKATLFHDAEGVWKLERADEIVTLGRREVFEIAGRVWRFSTPETSSATSTIELPAPLGSDLRHARLVFRVTKDEEHVEVLLERGRERADLGSRTHNYLLLYLARRRLDEAAKGEPEDAAGWLYQEEILDALRISPERLNVDIFRIRKQFATAEIADAAGIVERRPRTKQVRIGMSALVVERI